MRVVCVGGEGGEGGVGGGGGVGGVRVVCVGGASEAVEGKDTVPSILRLLLLVVA